MRGAVAASLQNNDMRSVGVKLGSAIVPSAVRLQASVDAGLYRSIKVGDRSEIRRRFTQEDVNLFAKLCGDTNQIHVNPEAAKLAGFRGCIVHGILVSSLFSNIMGTDLPGPQSVYVSQTLEFKAPVYVGDEIIASVEVEGFQAKRGWIWLRTQVSTPEGLLCVTGRAVGKNKHVSFIGESPVMVGPGAPGAPAGASKL